MEHIIGSNDHVCNPVAGAEVMSDPFDSRFAVAQDVAREAGRRALAASRADGGLAVETKGLQDRVTEVDRNVQSFIAEAIAARFPQDDFLGEESDAQDAPTRADGPLWVVDPIDGTDCFVFGLPSWCISIAWLDAGETRLGAIYDPIHDELFAAAEGLGATLNGVPIAVSPAGSLAAGLVGIGYSSRVRPQDTLEPLSRLMANGGMFHRCGSGALSLAWVAAGRLLGYFEPHINSWDCLAGLLIVREAGGRINDFLADDGLTRGGPVAAAAPGVAAHIGMIGGLDLVEPETLPGPGVGRASRKGHDTA